MKTLEEELELRKGVYSIGAVEFRLLKSTNKDYNGHKMHNKNGLLVCNSGDSFIHSKQDVINLIDWLTEIKGELP